MPAHCPGLVNTITKKRLEFVPVAEMMTVIVIVFEAEVAAAGKVSEKKADILPLWTPKQAPRTPLLVIEAEGQRYE